MSNISYPKAIASSLPFIGPAISLYSSSRELRECTNVLSDPTLSIRVTNAAESHLKKIRTYAIFGVASSILSIGALVGLHAFGLLPGPSCLFPISITAYSAFAIYLSVIAYKAKTK